MSELERLLTRAGQELDWPEAPELAPRVAERLRAGTPRHLRPRGIPLGRPIMVAVAGTLVLAATVAAAVPTVRDSVLDLLGLRGATVERRQTLPPVPPRSGPLALGERVTLQQAARLLSFRPLVPAALPAPDAVHVLPSATQGGELTLSYAPRAGLPEATTTGLGLLVSEFRGDLDPGYIGKIAPQATTVERLRVDGRPAIWLEGPPHFFFYRDPHGVIRESRHRLAANVLLLQHGRVLVRLEGQFRRQRAVELARSIG